MPAASLLALIDNIAGVLDDVATMTKVATKKTAGALGDDLALNAEQVSGVDPDRELPLVWAVAKGSVKNKAILVPAALALSALAPWSVTPVLMLGGTFLCYEGFEKVAHKVLHKKAAVAPEPAPALTAEELEQAKIRGAIRTDFVLSAEIIVIALGTVATAPLGHRLLVLCAIAAIMTVGVYGLVAGIVKLDDLGLALRRRSSAAARAVGGAILRAAPTMMKTLSVAGTLAMFMVGGSIVGHGVPGVHGYVTSLEKSAGPAAFAVSPLADVLVGLLVGALALLVVSAVARLVKRPGATAGER